MLAGFIIYNTGMRASVDYLVSTQHAGGGWGYSPGNKPVVEPTALVLMALRDEKEAEISFQRGMEWLLGCQHDDGGWGTTEDDDESGWQTAWALIAMKQSPQVLSATSRAVEWLVHEATNLISSAEFGELNLAATNGPEALVWPWLPGQVCWVEPTALALIALAHQELSPLASRRIDAAHAYLRQNRTPGAGWDIGNAGPLDTIVLPRAYPTALVLIALGLSSKQDVQSADVAALFGDMESDSGILAQSAGLLALRMLGEQDDGIFGKITRIQQGNGSWDDSIFFTAWATLALRGGF
jgi:hypothetical protein